MKQHIRGRRLGLLFFFVALSVLASCTGGQPTASWFGIAASEDTVYLAANERVLALNLESGSELWSFPPEPDRETGPFYATPLLRQDALIVGGFGDGKLYAISRNGGAEEWTVETEATIVEGAVSTDGGIIVGNNKGEVYLVEAETQTKELLLKADEPIWATPLVDEANGRVYVASMDHHLYALNLQGEQLWAFEAGGALAGTPALSDGRLYFGALNSTFYAIDAKTAEEQWRFDTEGWVWGGPLILGDIVYFGDMAGMFYALDAATGDERWSFQAEGGVRVKPVLADDRLYFGTRTGKVYALAADNGTQEWALPLPGSVLSQPVIQDEYLLISPHNAKVQLMALDTESGAERWSYPIREE